MTIETYILCFVAGLLGMAFHIFAVKLPGVKQAAKVANLKFSYGDYFRDDLAAILASLLAVLILLIVLPEIVAIRPTVVPFLRIGFIFVGFTGSSLLIKILGKATTKVNEVVDEKTDIADGKK